METPKTRGILLIGSGTVPLHCAEALKKHGVAIKMIVAGPPVPDLEIQRVAAVFDNAVPVIITKRPDQDPGVLDLIGSKSVDLLFSCFYDYRIRPTLLERVPGTNIHPSVLPHNGGFHSSFWGIYNNTPLGATIHWLAEGIDEGDIIGQKTIVNDGLCSAGEIRSRQRALCRQLFEEYLPLVLAGKAPRHQQPKEGGSYHFQTDIKTATTLDADDTLTMESLLRLARATSCGENGFFVKTGSRKFKIMARVSEVAGEDD